MPELERQSLHTHGKIIGGAREGVPGGGAFRATCTWRNNISFIIFSRMHQDFDLDSESSKCKTTLATRYKL